MRRYFAALAGALLLMGSLGGCGNGRQERVDQSHFAMDTYINISVYRAEDKAAAAACFDLMDRWDQMLSVTSETGEIAVLNRDGHAQLSHDTIALVEKALECADLTNGSFDPTLLPLKNLWRIGERSADEPLPSREEIAAAQGATGYGKVALSGDAITLSPGMGLDLGAIAKGYVADLCAQYLLDHGVSMGIINMGGNVRLLGGKDYNVGVRDPRGSENQLLLTINTRDCSIVTSGDYERYFEKDGVRYHHIFDPKRGYPADTDLSEEPYTVQKAEDEERVYIVEGPRIERMLGYTNLDSEKGFEFFQKFLKENGILEELEALGIEEGDTVRMYGLEFDYYK